MIGAVTGTVVGSAILVMSPLGWAAAGWAGVSVISGAIGDLFFGSDQVVSEVNINTKGLPDTWIEGSSPMAAYILDPSNANGQSLSENLLKIDMKAHYIGKYKELVTGTDYMKLITLLPSKWEQLMSDGLSNNPDLVKYSDISEGIIEANTNEELVALSTEELAEAVESKLVELYPNAISVAQMDAYLKTFADAKNLISYVNAGWVTAGTQMKDLGALIKGIKGSALASESLAESRGLVSSTEKTRYSSLVDKVNEYGEEGGLIGDIITGVNNNNELNDNFDAFYKFVLREKKSRGAATLRAFDSSRVSAINEKYVNVIKELNTKHEASLTALQEKWQKKFDTQAIIHDKAMAKMKADYEGVIKDLNATIDKYKKALDKSLGLLTQFSNKLEAKSQAEIDAIKNQSASMVDTTIDIRNHASNVRDRDYSVGVAQASIDDDVNARAFMAKQLADREAAENKKTFVDKYKKYALPALAVTSFFGLQLYSSNKAANNNIPQNTEKKV